jgi:diguanylate cyclase (GGDEF)-like protein
MSSFPHFDFNQPFDDARLAELRLLSFANQHGRVASAQLPEGPWRDLLLAALMDGLLSAFTYGMASSKLPHGPSRSRSLVDSSGIADESNLERAMVIAKVHALGDVLEHGRSALHMTHRGRTRLSELKQVLRSGREREPFGILWDGRHAELDLQITLLGASPASPVSVVFMDMNGLKILNDSGGHDVGDEGLRAYFQSVASALRAVGQAYRLGGDEVLVLLPEKDKSSAAQVIEIACRLLMKERLEIEGVPIVLSIAAGIVDVVDPGLSPVSVRKRADQEQYRAKEESRKTTPRPSVIGIENVQSLRVIEPSADAASGLRLG